jgi:sulfoxide reductase heme-binding subunit YedZ
MGYLQPFTRLVTDAYWVELGPDPVARILATTGTWSLNLLLVTLGITPFRKLTGWNWLVRLRRTAALSAFFYASLHLSAYLLFEHSFEAREIVKDLLLRPYVAAGWAAFVAMVPLAVTSTDSMMKTLGGRNWKALHRLTYLVGICAVFHYLWLVKRDITIPGYYAIIITGLLVARCTKTPNWLDFGPLSQGRGSDRAYSGHRKRGRLPDKTLRARSPPVRLGD